MRHAVLRIDLRLGGNPAKINLGHDAKPPLLAMYTPVEKIGSRNAAESPTITQRSPANRLLSYEKSPVMWNLDVRSAPCIRARITGLHSAKWLNNASPSPLRARKAEASA